MTKDGESLPARHPEKPLSLAKGRVEGRTSIFQTGSKSPFGKSVLRDSLGSVVMIQALDVDRAEPWPDGQDRQEDQALPV